MSKNKHIEPKLDSEEVKVVYDDAASEVEIHPMQIVHTPMGTTVKPAKFGISDHVKTTQKVDLNDVEIPEDVDLVVMGILGDDMYSLIGPEGLVLKLNGAYLEKVLEVD